MRRPITTNVSTALAGYGLGQKQSNVLRDILSAHGASAPGQKRIISDMLGASLGDAVRTNPGAGVSKRIAGYGLGQKQSKVLRDILGAGIAKPMPGYGIGQKRTVSDILGASVGGSVRDNVAVPRLSRQSMDAFVRSIGAAEPVPAAGRALVRAVPPAINSRLIATELAAALRADQAAQQEYNDAVVGSLLIELRRMSGAAEAMQADVAAARQAQSVAEEHALAVEAREIEADAERRTEREQEHERVTSLEQKRTSERRRTNHQMVGLAVLGLIGGPTIWHASLDAAVWILHAVAAIV